MASLTQTSIGPRRSSTSDAAASTASKSATSTGQATAFAPHPSTSATAPRTPASPPPQQPALAPRQQRAVESAPGEGHRGGATDAPRSPGDDGDAPVSVVA